MRRNWFHGRFFLSYHLDIWSSAQSGHELKTPCLTNRSTLWAQHMAPLPHQEAVHRGLHACPLPQGLTHCPQNHPSLLASIRLPLVALFWWPFGLPLQLLGGHSHLSSTHHFHAAWCLTFSFLILIVWFRLHPLQPCTQLWGQGARLSHSSPGRCNAVCKIRQPCPKMKLKGYYF